MSLAPLDALAADVVRLLAAGVAACAGDVGLARRAAELRALAGQVPALRPLADAAAQLAAPAAPDPPRLFLDLVVRVRQAQTAMVTTAVAGPLTPLPPSGPWGTTLPAAELPAWREDFLKRPGKACKRLTEQVGGNPFDLRLSNELPYVVPWVYGSNDSRLAPRQLPSWVARLLPEVLAVYDPAGDKVHGQRLSLLCRLDPALGLELVRQALDVGSVKVQRMAVRWLPQLAEPAEVLARLGPRVGRLEYELARPVAQALAHTGPALLPALLDLLRPPPEAFWQATLVLRALAPHHADALRPHTVRLLEALDPTRGSLHNLDAFSNLVEVLAALRPLAEDPTPLLLRLLEGASRQGRYDRNRLKYVLRALATLGFRWDLAGAAVLNVARTDPDTWTRRDAQRCLATAAAAGEVAAAMALVTMLGDAPNYMPHVASMFDELGPAGAMTVPGLILLLRGQNVELRAQALRALLGLGTVGLPAAEWVLASARAGKEDGAWALRVLGRWGSAVPEGLPLILAALESTDRRTWWSVWQALREYRPQDAIPVGPLMEKLGAADWGDRVNAAELLGRLGSLAVPALPALRKAASDPERRVQREAQSALRKIERAAARRRV